MRPVARLLVPTFALSMLGALTACSDDDDGDVVDTTGGPSMSDATDTTGTIDGAMFGDALRSVEQVDCTLESGNATTCLQLTFASNPVGDTEGTGTVGPYCPDAVTTPRDEVGLGVYDGATTPRRVREADLRVRRGRGR